MMAMPAPERTVSPMYGYGKARMTPPVTMMFASDSGIIHFQPRSMSWSKRKRGKVARNQTYISMKAMTLVMKMTAPRIPPANPMAWSAAVVRPTPLNARVQPPKKRITIRQQLTIMAEYSASMKKANFMAEYSA